MIKLLFDHKCESLQQAASSNLSYSNAGGEWPNESKPQSSRMKKNRLLEKSPRGYFVGTFLDLSQMHPNIQSRRRPPAAAAAGGRWCGGAAGGAWEL